MVIGNIKIKNTIETITAEIREAVILLNAAYEECEEELTSAVISCVMRSTNSSLHKADVLVASLLAVIEHTPSTTETTTPQTSFATRLRSALAHSGMTQGVLADWTGISQSTISSYVTGKVKEAGFVRSADMARALGVNVEWLIYGRGEMLPAKNLTKDSEV